MTLEKNQAGTYSLFYKKYFYEEASTVADYLPAYFLKLYDSDVLSIFDLYFQDLATDTTQVDDHPYYTDDLELYKAINDTVDLE